MSTKHIFITMVVILLCAIAAFSIGIATLDDGNEVIEETTEIEVPESDAIESESEEIVFETIQYGE